MVLLWYLFICDLLKFLIMLLLILFLFAVSTFWWYDKHNRFYAYPLSLLYKKYVLFYHMLKLQCYLWNKNINVRITVSCNLVSVLSLLKASLTLEEKQKLAKEQEQAQKLKSQQPLKPQATVITPPVKQVRKNKLLHCFQWSCDAFFLLSAVFSIFFLLWLTFVFTGSTMTQLKKVK